MSKNFSEKQPRSLSKVVSWRIIITISHIINGLLVTGSLAIAAQIAGTSAIINSLLYWAHERIWNMFDWHRQNNTELKFTEKQSRSFGKIISWRIIITINNFLIPYLTTGNWQLGLSFLTIATAINMVLYWAHERIWNRVVWGKSNVATE